MSWRDFFHRKRQLPPARPSAMGMVMLAGLDQFRADAAVEYLRKHWEDLPSIIDVQTDGPTTGASIPGGAMGMVHIPAPIPQGHLEGPIKLAWHWPEAAALVPGHQSHVIVHVGSTKLSHVEIRLLLTKLMASILGTTEGVGVYSGDALLVWSAAEYLAQTQGASRDALPILLWIGLHPVHDPPGLSAYTTGLTSFGFLELEAHRSALAGPDLLGRMADLAQYQLASGKALEDGDTFGESEFDRTRIRHVRSEFIPEMDVALLEI
jgi:Domain of unknown function (DUF4261)